MSSVRRDELDDDGAAEPLLTPTEATNQVNKNNSLKVDEDTGRYTYAYGPPGIRGLLQNRYTLGCVTFASLGGLTFGYDQGVIANVLVMHTFLARWPITPLQKGLMTALLELGCLVGALTAGTFADHISRRQSIALACIIFLIGSSIQGAALSLEVLTAGRAIGGLGVGALSMLSPLYMAEISPPELRGSLLALEQLAIVLGVVLGFWTGYFTRNIPSDAAWRTPLFLQLLPGILLLFGSSVLPPSPRLLVLQGRSEEAVKALARLRQREADDTLVQIELTEMLVEATLIDRTGAKGKQNWAALFKKDMRPRTTIGVFVMFFQQWSGINALLYYGPTLVRSLGFAGEEASLSVSGGIGIVQFFAVVPAILSIDNLGRRPLLRIGSTLMCISHISIAMLVFFFQDNWVEHPIAGWCAVGLLYLFTAAYGISFGPIGWVLPSEVFPLSVRSRGVALSTASNWFNNFLIGLVTPEFMQLSVPGTFALFATACFAAYLWATYTVPETRGTALEDMDAVFGGDAAKSDESLRRQLEDELGLTRMVATWTSQTE